MAVGVDMASAKADVEHIKCQSDNAENRKILDWMTLTNYGSNQSDTAKRREPGTGAWLLELAEYRRFLRDKKCTLFCSGIGGAGKTVLTSLIVDGVHRRYSDGDTVAIAYVYFDFRRRAEQTPEHVLASLLKQISERQSILPTAVTSLFQKHQKLHTLPSKEEFLHSLEAVLKSFSKTFIILDALDECDASMYYRSEILDLMLQLQELHSVSIFATGRPLPDIVSQLRRGLQVEIRAKPEDIQRFLTSRVGKLSLFQNNPRSTPEQIQDLQSQITSTLAKAADGM